MTAYGLIVRFELRRGHEEAFDALVAEVVPHIASDEPGTILYLTHRVDEEPRTRVFYELYRDRAAFDEHESRPHVRAFLEARAEHVESFEVDFLLPGPAAGV